MKQKGFTPLIILLFLVVIGLMGLAYFAGVRGLFVNRDVVISYNSPSPVPTTSTDNLETFYSPVLDITFNYDPAWKVSTGSYIGDVFLGPDADCQFVFKSGYLKDLNSCSDATIGSFSPGVTITSPDGQSYLQLTGPTSGLGGGCDENLCPQNPEIAVTIKDKKYNIKTVAVKSKNALYETLIGPQTLGIPSGSKSIWSKFDIYLTATNKESFETELKILQSIK